MVHRGLGGAAVKAAACVVGCGAVRDDVFLAPTGECVAVACDDVWT